MSHRSCISLGKPLLPCFVKKQSRFKVDFVHEAKSVTLSLILVIESLTVFLSDEFLEFAESGLLGS